MQNISHLFSLYSKRLGIIVPYRDRAEHLQEFIPHMLSYFKRDKLDRNLSYNIFVIEQNDGLDFNRGKLCNIGFVLSQNSSDYVCFHDVDYLPIWTDYAYCDKPTHLIWHGLHKVCRYPHFFGAVTMFNMADFEKVNGFSNEYWGWGEEDEELRERCKIEGLSLGRRKGTYRALPHKHAGFNFKNNGIGERTEAAKKNYAKAQKRLANLSNLYKKDGLNNLRYKLVEMTNIVLNGERLNHVFHYKVDLTS